MVGLRAGGHHGTDEDLHNRRGVDAAYHSPHEVGVDHHRGVQNKVRTRRGGGLHVAEVGANYGDGRDENPVLNLGECGNHEYYHNFDFFYSNKMVLGLK